MVENKDVITLNLLHTLGEKSAIVNWEKMSIVHFFPLLCEQYKIH